MNFNFFKLPMRNASISTLLGIALMAPIAGLAQSLPGDAAQKSAGNNDWRFSFGVSIISAPRFIGADKQRNKGLPAFDVRYQDWFFANPDKGIGVATRPLTGATLTAAIGYDGTSRDSKYDSRLNGVNKIGGTAALKLGAEYRLGEFKLSSELSRRLASTEKAGTKVRFEAGYDVITNKTLLLTAGVFGQVMDKTFARNFLSIDAAQSSITGLKTYEAKRGLLDSGVYVQALYRVDQQWTIFSKISLARLGSNAADSPIVQEKNQTTGLLAVSRSF
jgi:MipA family protein